MDDGDSQSIDSGSYHSSINDGGLTIDQIQEDMYRDFIFTFPCDKTVHMQDRMTKLMEDDTVHFNEKNYLTRLKQRMRDDYVETRKGEVIVRRAVEENREQFMMIRREVTVTPEHEPYVLNHPVYQARLLVERMLAEQKALPPSIPGEFMVSAQMKKIHKPKTMAQARKQFQKHLAIEQEQERIDKEKMQEDAKRLDAERRRVKARLECEFKRSTGWQAPIVTLAQTVSQLEHMYFLAEESIALSEVNKKGMRRKTKPDAEDMKKRDEGMEEGDEGMEERDEGNVVTPEPEPNEATIPAEVADFPSAPLDDSPSPPEE